MSKPDKSDVLGKRLNERASAFLSLSNIALLVDSAITAQVFTLGGNLRFFFLKSKKIHKPQPNTSPSKHLKVSV